MWKTRNSTAVKKVAIRKDAATARVLRRLRTFLDRKEPELVRILVRTWNTQGRAITYKEIREALLAGEISADLLDEWMQDYTKFVTDHLLPSWLEAMDVAAKELTAKYPEWNYMPFSNGVREWTSIRAAEFVTNSTNAQIEGLRAVIRRAAGLEDMTVDELARAVRPMVGLTKQQGIANMNYYESLIKNGVSKKRALELSTKYAAKMHRYRGYNIARTELAFAYNHGAHEGIKQAQAAGYMGEMVKVWCTADDERTCEYCNELEGKVIAMDEDFDFKTRLTTPGIKLTPPAHPGCRCTVLYQEVSPPIYQNR